MIFEILTWVLALLFTFSSFFFNKKSTILILYWISLFFYSSHLIIVWSVISWLFLFVQIFRNIFFSYNFSRKTDTIWLLILLATFLLIYIFRENSDPLSWLTLIWSIIWTLACWVKNTKYVRLLFLFSTVPWLCYVFSLELIYPIILQVVLATSLLINIVRFDILKMKEKVL